MSFVVFCVCVCVRFFRVVGYMTSRMPYEERLRHMEKNLNDLLEQEDVLQQEIVTARTVRRIATVNGAKITDDAAETIAAARNADALRFIENVLAVAEKRTVTEMDVSNCFTQSTGKRLFIDLKKNAIEVE